MGPESLLVGKGLVAFFTCQEILWVLRSNRNTYRTKSVLLEGLKRCKVVLGCLVQDGTVLALRNLALLHVRGGEEGCDHIREGGGCTWLKGVQPSEVVP